MSIEKALLEWSGSAKGKDALKIAKNKAVRDAGTVGHVFGDKGDSSVEDIAYEVISRFSYYIEEAGFDFGDLLEITGAQLVQIGDDLLWEVAVDFVGNTDDLSRESWYPEKYPAGAYDIIRLLNNGYEASDYVYKKADTADGKKVVFRSLKTREGARFMNQAEYASNEAGAESGYWVEIHPRFVNGWGI